MSNELLMLPDHPDFNAVLALNPPPGLQEQDGLGRVAVIGADGMPRGISGKSELDDYLFGGEWELVTSFDPDEEEEDDEGEW